MTLKSGDTIGIFAPSSRTDKERISQGKKILESNGSSSMASVCAGSLALMDCGVPTQAAVSGIAMGLLIDGDDFVILTDIQGLEDHYGDMDFKVAGTSQGITAIQLDIKINHINMEIVKDTFKQAKEARSQILDAMLTTIEKPNKENKMKHEKWRVGKRKEWR